jgi:SAM-dependent methyltransferase
VKIRDRKQEDPNEVGLVDGPRLKVIDLILQRWRMAKVAPYIPEGARVLDVGSRDGALFRYLRSRISWGLGLDPVLKQSVRSDRFELVAGEFPRDAPASEPFDAITMLAVLEHVPSTHHVELREECARLLKEDGVLIITVPSPLVDRILELLVRLRLIAGMALHEHHGFNPNDVPERFSGGGLVLVRTQRFQLGLNNLFVFRRTA